MTRWPAMMAMRRRIGRITQRNSRHHSQSSSRISSNHPMSPCISLSTFHLFPIDHKTATAATARAPPPPPPPPLPAPLHPRHRRYHCPHCRRAFVSAACRPCRPDRPADHGSLRAAVSVPMHMATLVVVQLLPMRRKLRRSTRRGDDRSAQWSGYLSCPTHRFRVMMVDAPTLPVQSRVPHTVRRLSAP